MLRGDMRDRDITKLPNDATRFLIIARLWGFSIKLLVVGTQGTVNTEALSGVY